MRRGTIRGDRAKIPSPGIIDLDGSDSDEDKDD